MNTTPTSERDSASFNQALQTALREWDADNLRALVAEALHERAKSLFFGAPIAAIYADLIETAHALAFCGDSEAVHRLLEAGFHVDTILNERRGWNCDTMLQAAAAGGYAGRGGWAGQASTLTALLFAGADPHRVFSDQYFPWKRETIVSTVRSLRVARIISTCGGVSASAFKGLCSRSRTALRLYASLTVERISAG